MQDLQQALKCQVQHELQFRCVKRVRDSQFDRREFRVVSRQLIVPSRSGRGNYSTWHSLDFCDPCLVDTQMCKTFVEKCSEWQFWGFFAKYFKNIFCIVFGLFRGSKRGAPAPVRGSGKLVKIKNF